MPAPVTAPAPAPASAPVAAPNPSSAPPPDNASPQPIEKAIEFDSDIDAELASMDDEKPRQKPQVKPPVKPQAKPQPTKAKPEPEPEKDPEDEAPPEEQPDDKAKPDADSGKPIKAADLRTAYETLKKKVKDDYEPKVTKLQARIKELETGGSEQVEALKKDLEEKVKRLESLDNDMRFIDYKKSSEYLEKYEKPYQEAWAKAQTDLDELTVPNDDGTSRKAEMADLLHLANLPLGEARTVARQMFGDAADDVMAHRREIRNLSQAQEKALKDAKANSSEHQKKLEAQRQIQHQETLKLWDETNKTLAQKYPKWFAEVEGDQEGNQLLKKGFSLADLHFVSAKGLTPEQIALLPDRFKKSIETNGDLNLQDRVALDALLRNKIASHTRIARDLKKATTRIAELEKSLADYEGSGPTGKPKEGGGGNGSVDANADAAAELDAIDRKYS